MEVGETKREEKKRYRDSDTNPPEHQYLVNGYSNKLQYRVSRHSNNIITLK